jgi:hypothetical protein
MRERERERERKRERERNMGLRKLIANNSSQAK